MNLTSSKNGAISTKDIRDELGYPFYLSVGKIVGIEARRVVIANAGTTWSLGVGKSEEAGEETDEQDRRNSEHFMHKRCSSLRK